MIPNAPVVAAVGVVTVGVVTVEAVGVLTVDSDAVVNIVGVTVLSAKHINTQL